VSKEPEVRKQEIVQAAKDLFNEKGYDHTAVSDIVKRVGVAQGTFYYHFRSKEEVLDAISENLLNVMKTSLDEVVDRADLSATEKIFLLLSHSSQFKETDSELIHFIHEERNELLHHRIEKRGMIILGNSFQKLVRQGVEEGVFKTDYPDEAAIGLLGAASWIFQGHENDELESPEMKRRIAGTIDVIERILGCDKGTISKMIQDIHYS